jgi:hypothetical protein
MIWTLAFRHLFVKRVRALVLLLGFALGVGVMIVLLSVGEAMLAQSRDVALVGGGEVTVLPQGIDIEAMANRRCRGGMFFGIDRARAVTRTFLGGPRTAGSVRAVAPALEYKLLYLGHGRPRDAGEGRAARFRVALGRCGARLDLIDGTWAAFTRRHRPGSRRPCSSSTTSSIASTSHPAAIPRGGEWHYFNVVTARRRGGGTSPISWAVTYRMAAGAGQLLVTRRRPDGRYERYGIAGACGARAPRYHARRSLARRASRPRSGRGAIASSAPRVGPRVACTSISTCGRSRNATSRRSSCARDVVSLGLRGSGLRSDASGPLCAGSACREVREAPAYHDHNWGVWRDVSWEWGQGAGRADSTCSTAA